MASGRRDKRPFDTKGLNLGVELAAALVGFALLGVWIDHRYETSPWGTLICVVLGLIGGFYNFLRASLQILRSPDRLTPGRSAVRQHRSASPPSDDVQSPDRDDITFRDETES